MRRIDRKSIKETLLELEPKLEGAEEDGSYRTALVLLAAIACGPDTTRLADVTELPRQCVAEIRQRMIRAQLLD